jgi:acetyl-CoA carboxylase carboxyltransferase component
VSTSALRAIESVRERATPTSRLEALCDPGSFAPIRTAVTSTRMGAKAVAGDGVIAGAGRVAGRQVFCYAQDAAFAGGSLGAAHADTICRTLELAARSRSPVVSFVASGGARMQEGLHAMGGYGRIFRATVQLSGVVPQISVVVGTSAGGGAYSPALTDFVVMTEAATMFLTGPGVVREVLGEDLSAAELGGPRVHELNGVTDLVAPDDAEAAMLARRLLTFLPAAGEQPPPAPSLPPRLEDPGAVVPEESRQVYDVRLALEGIVDAGSLLELSPRWARNMVCGLARLEGRAVGVVANQPKYLGGVIDAEGSEKAARFVSTCDRFGLPLLVFADTPGFMPGGRQERTGVIRYGADLLRAFAAAGVPKLTVVLRKAYGGAYITMNSKGLGADLVFAWPGAELGIMGANQAVGVIHRRESDERRAVLADAYAEEHLGAESAARDGFVDEIVVPAETRGRLAWALDALSVP